MDKTGTWIIEPKYDDASHFVNDFSCVTINGKYGLIDKNGNWIMEIKSNLLEKVNN